MATIDKRNFTRGIFSPVVQARRDVDAWHAGAKRLTNVTLMKYGGVKKRPGTLFVYRLPDADNETRLLPFTYSTGQSYALLFGQGTMKPFAGGGAVVSDGFGITGITNANPGVVTAPFHGLSTGREVYFSRVQGMTELNGRTATITFLTADTFRIDINTTDFGAFTGDGGADVRTAAPDPEPTVTVPPATSDPEPIPTTPPGGGSGGSGDDVVWGEDIDTVHP